MEEKKISYEDFKKMDIRVCTIRHAERIPNTDKLIKCIVDMGNLGERTVVSGIAQWYKDAEELIGKQCLYVVNLEPRTICGVKSNGMLMAVSFGDDDFALLNPNKKVPSGVRVN